MTSRINGLVTLTVSFPSQSAPCAASGGIPGDGWAGSSVYDRVSIGVTSAVAQTVAYSITCTYAQYQAHAQTQVTYDPPSATQPSAPAPSVTLSPQVQHPRVLVKG